MAKRSFILFHDYIEQFLCLPDEECGQLIKAIFVYETEGEVTALPPEARMAFRFIRHALDENRNKYADICKKRREVAKKGGAPLGNTNAKKTADDETTKTTNWLKKQPKQPDTDTVTDTVTETVTDTVTDTDTETEIDTVTETETVTEPETEQEVCSENTENTPTPQKTARGEFLNVFLTAEEFARLLLDYGADTANKAIDLLSTRIARDNNSKYKNENHYATIKSWVITAVLEKEQREKGLFEKQKTKETKSFSNSCFADYDLEDIFEKV